MSLVFQVSRESVVSPTLEDQASLDRRDREENQVRL